MRIAIIGFAREGQAAYGYWKDKGEITVCDKDPHKQVPSGVTTQLGEDYLQNLDRFDVIVRTAGLHPQEIAQANPQVPDILEKITTSATEFLRACPTRNIIGVTGTKGKGTTSLLIVKMLEAAGCRTHLGGNVGIPPLKLLEEDIQPDDWVVLELSSFQLIDLKSSPHIAVCVMVTPEHLNWHHDYEEYLTAKQQLFRWQKPDDIAVYYGANEESRRVAEVSPAQLIPYMQAPGAEVLHEERIVIDGQPICRTDEIKLLGKHNWQNVCAAVTTVWQVTPDASALHKAIVRFEPLEHRLEPVREISGVQFYNDSFSSAPGSTIVALDAVPGSKVLIVGGFDKNQALGELADAISAHEHSLRKVLVIGAIGPRIAKALQQHGYENYEVLRHTTIGEIVAHAAKYAEAGDKVVFSPGSSSFDMFKDFVDRGEQFKEAVHRL